MCIPICLRCSPRKLAYNAMAYVESIQLCLSLVTLLFASLILWAAWIQTPKWLYREQLCICIYLLLLAITQVVLGSLQISLMPGGTYASNMSVPLIRGLANKAIANAIDILNCVALTAPPVFEVWFCHSPYVDADTSRSSSSCGRFFTPGVPFVISPRPCWCCPL